MIATRFRAVGWVAGVAGAALSCYLVSLQVASERGQLMKTERRILSARADIRQLRMELDTRGRLVQLERWNSDVLGLQAPKASQYAHGEVQLAGYVQPRSPGVPQVVTAAAAAPAPTMPAVTAVAYKAPAPVLAAPVAAPVRPPAAARPAPPPVIVAEAQPLVRHATFVRTEPAAPVVRRAALLGDQLLGEIGRAAADEARPGKR